MGLTVNKILTTTCIAALIVLSSLTVSLVQAQTAIPKPDVPTFTAKLFDHSYDVPATSSVDPFTGQTVNHSAYHVENYTISITIENQPYTPFLVQEGTSNWTANFYYNIREKGHYGTDWINIYSPDSDYPIQSNSTYTVLTYNTRGDNGPDFNGRTLTLNPGDQVDFQVQALIGATHRGYNATATNQLEMYPFVFDGETSGWSSTQTVTIPANPVTATLNPTATPIQDMPTINNGAHLNAIFGLDYGEIIIIVILSIIALLLVVLILVFRKRNVRQPNFV
jgi:hypothetical protein